MTASTPEDSKQSLKGGECCTMNDATLAGATPAELPGDSCLDDHKSLSSTPSHQCPFTPPVPASPLLFGASPAPRPFPHTPLAVTCLVEYLREEPRTLHLDPHLFPEGLQPGEVVEVSGNANCGKSLLTLSLIASALLPTVWCGVRVAGCNAGVTFIDCEQHFSIFQLVGLMYKRVKTRVKLAKDALKEHKMGRTSDNMTAVSNIQKVSELLKSNTTSLKDKIQDMVQGRLKSFYYIKCLESVQFPITVASLDEHLAKNSEVALVVLDSLSAFSWYDWIYRGGGKFVELKNYYDRVLGVLLGSVKKYNVALIAVKQMLFLKNSEEPSRKTSDELDEETEMSREERVTGDGDGDDDSDMEEGDTMENMTESEYLGCAWVSSVTCQVITSKVKVDARTRSAGTLGTLGTKNGTPSKGPSGDGKEEMFSAEVMKGQHNTKLFFVIGDEGVKWRQV